MSNSINQNVAPITLKKCEIIQKGSNIIRQQSMRNYDWQKKTSINQNVAPTTLEECEIIQGCTLEDNKHSFQVKAIYQNLTKAISAERKQCDLRYCCSFCVSVLSFCFSLLLKKIFKKSDSSYLLLFILYNSHKMKKKNLFILYILLNKKKQKSFILISVESCSSVWFFFCSISLKKRKEKKELDTSNFSLWRLILHIAKSRGCRNCE